MKRWRRRRWRKKWQCEAADCGKATGGGAEAADDGSEATGGAQEKIGGEKVGYSTFKRKRQLSLLKSSKIN